MTDEAEQPGPPRKRAGRLELAVRRDLRDLGKHPPAGGAALAEIALIMARAVDDATGPLTARAKMAQELRITMAELRGVARDSATGNPDDGQSTTPVWDAPVAGASDVGAAGS